VAGAQRALIRRDEAPLDKVTAKASVSEQTVSVYCVRGHRCGREVWMVLDKETIHSRSADNSDAMTPRWW
jgi:hypothetical protein